MVSRTSAPSQPSGSGAIVRHLSGFEDVGITTACPVASEIHQAGLGGKLLLPSWLLGFGDSGPYNFICPLDRRDLACHYRAWAAMHKADGSSAWSASSQFGARLACSNDSLGN